ncbi:phage holin, lambda family [Lonsdalea quercina]|uniref:phage holin, lambda family n=1 Tax=Lonsdalea quercina TaxID=71657 RepID=UPI003975A66B
MRMQNNDYGFWADIANSLKNSWPQLFGAILAVLIRYGMLIYNGTEKKNEWIEGVLCGLLTLAITTALDVFGLPITVSPAIGGAIGFIGVKKLSQMAVNAFNKRFGVGDEDK